MVRKPVLLLGLLAAEPVAAMGIQVDVIPNFVGAGVGVTTEWLGSKDQVAGIVPGGRKQLENNRFIELWQRITGDGADSPIVTQRGDRDQISAGIGIGYSW